MIGPARLAALALAAAAAACVAVAAARQSALLAAAEFWLHDWMQARLAADGLAPDVAIVALDDAAIAAWGWPLPDAVLARLVDAAVAAGARAVGVDLYRDRPVGEGLPDLAAAMARPGVVGVFALPRADAPGIAPPVAAPAADRHGFADVPIDDDGRARRALLLVSDAGGVALSLAFRLVLVAEGETGLRAAPDDPQVLLLGATAVPRLDGDLGAYRGLDDAGYQIMLQYRHALPVAEIVPARALLDAAGAGERLRGRIVIIGSTSRTVKDQFLTPLARDGADSAMHGVQLHATAVQQLLDHWRGGLAPLAGVSPEAARAMLAAAALLGAAAGAVLRRLVALLLGGPGLALAVGAAMAAALGAGLWLPALPVALAWGAGALLAAALRGADERRQYRAVTRLFADHLSPALAADLWRHRDLILRGGRPEPRRLTATVLFADLAGSTAVGGSAEPRAYLDWVGRLLDTVGRIATEHGGFVEKFTGDGIMVVFGAPLPSGEPAAWRRDALQACRCAEAMAAAVAGLNARGDRLARYRLRIGLHSGPVFGGLIGHSGTLRYNVMGDTVNVAARLEAFGKRVSAAAGADCVICLSGAVAALAVPPAQVSREGVLDHDDGAQTIEVFRLVRVAPEAG